MLLRRFLIAAAMALTALPAMAQSTDPSFNLVNRSGRTIMEAYASPASESNWGADRLGRDVVQNGQSYAIRLPQGECVYDVRVVYQDRTSEERRNLNTCQITDVVFTGQRTGQSGGNQPGGGQPGGGQPGGGQPGGGQPGGGQPGGGQAGQVPQGNPSFNLVNNTGRTIRELYASLSTDQNWGEDRLGQDMVPTGRTYAVRLPQGDCVYDVRVVFDNNQAQERRRLNLCEVTNLTFP
ncbi:MAG TPA: hypothetical protein VGM87_08775 [Roseomonas sp.]|jgi:hypothetical protein